MRNKRKWCVRFEKNAVCDRQRGRQASGVSDEKDEKDGTERKRDSHRLDDVPVALPRLGAARTGPARLRAVALDLPPLALCAVGRAVGEESVRKL